MCPVSKWSAADVGSPANPGGEGDLGWSAQGTGAEAIGIRLCVREAGGVTGGEYSRSDGGGETSS